MSFGGGGGKKGNEVKSEKTSLANPITFYKSKTGKYPSNTQTWWSMKRPPEVGTDRPPKQYLEVFDPGLRYQISTGNTPVAKGHFIIDAFHQDRSKASGVANIPLKSASGARPAATAFYAGRAWYAGAFASGFNTHLYFTQILERPEQVAECYQAADPTAEDIRDLLPSDGGVVVVPEVIRVIHMSPNGQTLFILASNGVWAVSGSNGSGFSANDYSVGKVSGIPALTNMSVVDVEGVPMWWNRSGIYTLIPDEGGQLRVQSMTDNTIKSFYDGIPEQSKQYAKGTYDPLKKRIQYLYRSTETDNEEELQTYDRVLNLDARSGAWYPWTLPDTRVDFKGIFTMEGSSVEQDLVRIIVGSDFVVSGTDDVYSFYTHREIVSSKIKYVVNVLAEDVTTEPDDATPIPDLAVVAGADTVLSLTDNVVVSP